MSALHTIEFVTDVLASLNCIKITSLMSKLYVASLKTHSVSPVASSESAGSGSDVPAAKADHAPQVPLAGHRLNLASHPVVPVTSAPVTIQWMCGWMSVPS